MAAKPEVISCELKDAVTKAVFSRSLILCQDQHWQMLGAGKARLSVIRKHILLPDVQVLFHIQYRYCKTLNWAPSTQPLEFYFYRQHCAQRKSAGI